MDSNSRRKFNTKEEAYIYYKVEKVVDSIDIAYENNISHSKACNAINKQIRSVMKYFENDPEGFDDYLDGSQFMILDENIDGHNVMCFSRSGFLTLVPYELSSTMVKLSVECTMAMDAMLEALDLNFADLFNQYIKEKGKDKDKE